MNVKLLIIAEQRRNITNQKLTYAENFLAAGYCCRIAGRRNLSRIRAKETQLIAERNAIFTKKSALIPCPM